MTRRAAGTLVAALALGLLLPMHPALAADAGDGAPTDRDRGKTGQGDRGEPKRKITKEPVSVSIGPSDVGRVGVGELVTMNFSYPVARKKAVERAIKVKSGKTLPPGAWGWIDSDTAVYRPRRFWPGMAKIRFKLNLNGVVLAKAGDTKYVGNGQSGRTYILRTARSFIVRIKDKRHRMYVYRGGRMVRSFAVSLGKPGYETRSGVKILTGEKYVRLRMTGTDRYTGERWDVISPYSIRLTPTGEFIHGAPWAYYRLGRANGSHGCTNMYVADARWMYNNVRRGDPVITRGTGRPMEVTNGIPGAYWNYSWNAWKAKSALH